MDRLPHRPWPPMASRRATWARVAIACLAMVACASSPSSDASTSSSSGSATPTEATSAGATASTAGDDGSSVGGSEGTATQTSSSASADASTAATDDGPPAGEAPSVLGSALVADNETEGAISRTAIVSGVSTADATVLSWVAVRTDIFDGPPVGNNGNTHAEWFAQAYTPNYPQYSLRGYVCTAAAGGDDHAVTVTKDGGDLEEMTLGVLVLSGGEIVDDAVVMRPGKGAGATHTSGSVTVDAPALLVAVASGSGDINATAPSETWPDGWTVHESVARSSAEAPSGHVPFYLATRAVDAGTYDVDVGTTIDEGILIALYAVR